LVLLQFGKEAGDPVTDTQLGKGNEKQSEILNRPEGTQLRGIQGIGIKPKDIDGSQDHADIGKNGGLDTLLGDFTHCRKVEKKEEFLRIPASLRFRAFIATRLGFGFEKILPPQISQGSQN
jgi:hypothetical protein